MTKNIYENRENVKEDRKHKIKEIERLEIKAIERAELILVLLGAKESAIIDVSVNDVDLPEKVAEVLRKQCGLSVREIIKEQLKTSWPSRQYAIALDDNTAQNLANLDPTRHHQEVGKLLGYPQSATDGFVGLNTLDRKNWPDMKGIIFRMALSKENYQQEIELLKKWSDLIKENAPETYEILSRYTYFHDT